MYINNKDLEFLIELENEIGCDENWSDRVKKLWKKLWELNEKLIKQREENNKKTREAIAEKRKTNKNYARSKR